MTNSVGNGWAAALITEIKDPKNYIISSENAVVIYDKYPKARHHYLVLPKADIPDVFHLNVGHLSILEEMHFLAQNVIEGKSFQLDDFKIGFHAHPSMQRLHLHVISKDFVSDCLKKKRHWVNFNTEIFLQYQEVYARLKTDACIKRFTKEKIEELTASTLECNQCEFGAKNLPDLKRHLLEHWARRQSDKFLF